MKRSSVLAIAASAIATLGGVPAALANPRPLPYTYTYPTLPKGAFEVEQFVDFTPVKAISTSTGEETFYGATQFVTEVEIGITDRLELGVYVSLVPRPGETLTSIPVMPEGNGSKQRLRYRVLDQGELPIDLAFYGEVVENEREIELEAKVIAARRFGPLQIAANLSGEMEAYFNGELELVLNPSVGISYEVVPAFHPGFEYWMRAEFPLESEEEEEEEGERGFNLGPHHYLGATFMFNFGPAWWSTGIYARLDDVGYVLEPGDAYGELWARTIVGFGI